MGDSPKRIVIVNGGRRRGRTALVDAVIEQRLDAGETVITASLDGSVEVRGAGAAKDITPMAKRSLAPPGSE